VQLFDVISSQFSTLTHPRLRAAHLLCWEMEVFGPSATTLAAASVMMMLVCNRRVKRIALRQQLQRLVHHDLRS
jgi:hypothetical protein